MGIATIKSELTFIVDSDDRLTEDAVSSIYEIYKKYQGESGLCGFVFLRTFPDGRVNGKQFSPNEKIGSYIDIRVNGHDTHSDKAEVFYTRCLSEFPFPEYPGEKFLGEDIVWVRMGRKYQMVHINKAIYIGDYLEDGLTNNRRKNNISSPIGCIHRAEEFLNPDIKIKYRVKAALQYVVYGQYAKVSIIDLLKRTKCKTIVVMCTLPGLIIYQRWKNLYNR